MSNESKFEGWALVLNSVRTPLGFFTLLALVLDGVLLAVAALTEEISLLAPLGALALLILGVFLIVWQKPLALYHPSDWPAPQRTVTVNLLFPIDAIEVDLDVGRCVIETRDNQGRQKGKRTPNLIFGHGGWAFQLTEDVEASDSVRLELVEGSGRQWKVNPFAPYDVEKTAILVARGTGG